MSIQLKEKIIRGKKIRTNNQRLPDIIQLWSEVPKMELEGEIYAVYSNYESNFNGDYDLLIGNEAAAFQASSVVQAGDYLKFEVPTATPEGVGEVWRQIWRDTELEQKRAYRSDLEHYKKDGTIAIYLSI